MNRGRVTFGAVLLLLLGAAFWQALFPRSRQPVYEGKRLSSWVEAYFDNNGREPFDPQVARASDLAIQKMGTNSLPWLVAMLGATDTLFKSKLIEFLGDHPWLRIRITSAVLVQARAVMALRALGPAASAAIPDLEKLLNDARTSAATATVMTDIGPATIPALTRALTNANSSVRDDALRALESFQEHAREIIPFMLKHLRDTDPWVRLRAAEGLGKFKEQPETVVPALIESLKDKDYPPRKTAAEALGEFREQARTALPALLQALHDKDQELRMRAAISIWLIDPDTAARAGIDVFKEKYGDEPGGLNQRNH